MNRMIEKNSNRISHEANVRRRITYEHVFASDLASKKEYPKRHQWKFIRLTLFFMLILKLVGVKT